MSCIEMKGKERDKFDDLFRSKLEDFEMDTMPGDWEAIADRLPKEVSVPFRKTLYYWAAAAVVSLLMITGSVYLFNHEQSDLPIAKEIIEHTKEIENHIIEDKKVIAEVSETSVKQDENKTKKMNVSVVRPPAKSQGKRTMISSHANVVPEVNMLSAKKMQTDSIVTADFAQQLLTEDAKTEDIQVLAEKESQNKVLIADATPVIKKKKSTASRKWGFGMGGGGLSIGADNTVPQYMMKSALLTSDQLLSMNAPFFNEELPKTDVHHKTPVSFGLSVSRYLNNRFSLQTGLNYSFLSSEWTTNGSYHGEVKQKLHFIGIPLSVAYKIAEWNRFQVYAAAGAMAEVNVAGKQRSKFFFDDKEISVVSERVRMKEWLWSVNARAGVSYPLIRFVSAFAEVGAGYYFDNGSSIETIHSEKPFNVNFQLGFRLGF